MGRGVNRKKLDEYKQQLELLHLGLEDKIDLPVGVLSGGQRQALALLISTMTPIELLVLDEHTAALDPKSSENVMELTDRIVREKQLSAIMVTHNSAFAVEYGTRLLMMDKGACVMIPVPTEKRITRSTICCIRSTRFPLNAEIELLLYSEDCSLPA